MSLSGRSRLDIAGGQEEEGREGIWDSPVVLQNMHGMEKKMKIERVLPERELIRTTGKKE